MRRPFILDGGNPYYSDYLRVDHIAQDIAFPLHRETFNFRIDNKTNKYVANLDVTRGQAWSLVWFLIKELIW